MTNGGALDKVYNLDNISNLINLYNAKIDKYSAADKDVDYKGVYGTFRLQPFSMDPTGKYTLPDIVHERGDMSAKYDIESGMRKLKSLRAMAHNAYNIKRCTNELEDVIEDSKIMSSLQAAKGYFGEPLRTQGNNEAGSVFFASRDDYSTCIVIYKEDSFENSSRADIILETIDDPEHGKEPQEIGKVCDVDLNNRDEIMNAVQSFYHSFELGYNEWNRNLFIEKTLKEHPESLNALLSAELVRQESNTIEEGSLEEGTDAMEASGIEL